MAKKDLRAQMDAARATTWAVSPMESEMMWMVGTRAARSAGVLLCIIF